MADNGTSPSIKQAKVRQSTPKPVLIIYFSSTEVVVVHEKSEVTLERSDPNKTFDFLWRAEVCFDKHFLAIKQTKFRLVKVHFPLKTDPATQTTIKSLLELVLSTA